MFTVYILYSKSIDKHYIGMTSCELAERLRRHLSAHGGYTARAKDWEVIYTEVYEFKQEAHQRELHLKRWKSKDAIIRLIRNENEKDI